MYTEAQLTEPITPAVYAQHPYDWAEFAAARVAFVSKPTPALIVTTVPYDPRQSSSLPVSPNSLSTGKQALDYYTRFVSLGMDPKVPIHHNWVGSGVQTIEWNGELRRMWAVGPFQVGEVLLQYAKNPAFEVDLAHIEAMKVNKIYVGD